MLDPSPQYTPPCSLRYAISILVLDVTVFLALFYAGVELQCRLNAATCMTAVFLTPPFIYAWWRGVLPNLPLLDAMLIVALLVGGGFLIDQLAIPSPWGECAVGIAVFAVLRLGSDSSSNGSTRSDQHPANLPET
jgi:hypothetical protein